MAGMRGLKVLVVVMGVLIVAASGVLVAVLVKRAVAPPAPVASATLDEPTGSRIAATALGADRLAVTMNGGGPDRVVVIDLRTGQVVGRVSLAPAAAPR
jgi:hypothetical protein